jgi:hypothetical protein
VPPYACVPKHWIGFSLFPKRQTEDATEHPVCISVETESGFLIVGASLLVYIWTVAMIIKRSDLCIEVQYHSVFWTTGSITRFILFYYKNYELVLGFF